MSQKPPRDPVSTSPTAAPATEPEKARSLPLLPRAADAPPRAPGDERPNRFIRGSTREERLRRRAEEEAESLRTGIPLAPRRTFIQERAPAEIEGEEEDEELADDPPLGIVLDSDRWGGGDAFIWRPQKDFPAFLRKVREEAKVSLRQAAPALGMSAAYLSRLETGGPARQPSLERLNKMAALYNVDRHTMYGAAGVHVGLPENYDMLDYTDDEFEAIMLDPALQPGMMTNEALNYFSPRMKRQMVEFAKSLAALDDPAAYLNRLLRKVQGLE